MKFWVTFVIVRLTEDKRGEGKSSKPSQRGSLLQLTAWRCMSREETLHLVIDLSYLLTAIEEESTELQISCQFETTSLPNCLERQPNKKQLNNKSVARTTVEVETKRQQQKKIMDTEMECLQNWEKMNAVSLHISQCHDRKVVESCPSFLFKMQRETSTWAVCATIQPSDRLHLNPSKHSLFILLSKSFILVVSLHGNRSQFFTAQEGSVPLFVSDCTDGWCKWSGALYTPMAGYLFHWLKQLQHNSAAQLWSSQSWLFPQMLMVTFLVPIVTWHGKIFQING